jgi:DNA modification methylase
VALYYSGNRLRPTEKSVETLRPLVEAFTKPGDVVLDPFAGSGSSLAAAALLGRQYLDIELEPKYCDIARLRIAGVKRYLGEITRILHTPIQKSEAHHDANTKTRTLADESA